MRVSLAKIKVSMIGMTFEERQEVAARIAHLNQARRKADATALARVHPESASQGR